MKRFSKILLLTLFVLVFMVSSLLVFASSKEEEAPSKSKLAATELQILKPDNVDEVQPINPKNVGPNGNPASGVEDLVGILTPADEEAVMNGNYTAAVALHTTAADWSILQEAGIRAVLDKYNIELLVLTDAELKVEKQVGDIESIIELKPDLLIGFPVDRQANAAVFRKAADAGITMSFIDTIPADFIYPRDYKGLGLADNYEAGVVAAEIMAEEIDFKGKLGVMWFPFSMFHVDQRYYGIMDYLEQYSEIEVVDVQKPGNAEQAATIAENWLIAYPDLTGIVAVWDQQAIGAAGVIDASGKDVKVTGVDLSDDSAFMIATSPSFIGVSSQHPYDQGIAEALIGVVALAGKNPPPYVVVPIEKVTPKSLERSYKRVFRKDPPSQLQKEIDKLKAKGVIKD